MGRKKGRQAGEFQSKSQHAVYRHTVYVDRASEANQYRNPTADLGRGHGYRDESPSSDGMAGSTSGYWHINGSAYGGGDKWSSIFSSCRSSTTRARSSMPPGSSTSNGNNANRATMGLSQLRHLLEERRSEDRVYDRQHRLRLHRSRMIELNGVDALPVLNSRQKSTSNNIDKKVDRHESGWLMSHEYPTNYHTENYEFEEENTSQSTATNSPTSRTGIPSLQILAAQTLGPLLPMYCAACGNDFVGESLKSVSASVLSELSISLANADWSSTSQSIEDDSAIFATTDGAIQALVKSGVADELVLRGAPLTPANANAIDSDDKEDNDDTRWLSDYGLLSLCPRILSTDTEEDINNCFSEEDDSSHEHWETLDFDMCLNSRMTGCFHLKRLELIDIPLQRNGASPSSGGISLQALRSVLRSCSSITHLSLSGCCYNWEDADCLPVDEKGDISLLLGGSQSLSSLTKSIHVLGKLRGNGKSARDLIPTLLFHRENKDHTGEISGLDAMLPELRVLDVSYCNWVSEGQLIQLLLKFWEKALHSSVKVGGSALSKNQWDEEGEYLCTDATNACMNKRQAKIKSSLQHINIRGAGTEWLEKWKGHGLFDGIDVSTERQFRLK